MRSRVSLALNPGLPAPQRHPDRKGNNLVRRVSQPPPAPGPAHRGRIRSPRFRALHPHDARIDDAVLDVERATVQAWRSAIRSRKPIAQRRALQEISIVLNDRNAVDAERQSWPSGTGHRAPAALLDGRSEPDEIIRLSTGCTNGWAWPNSTGSRAVARRAWLPPYACPLRRRRRPLD